MSDMEETIGTKVEKNEKKERVIQVNPKAKRIVARVVDSHYLADSERDFHVTKMGLHDESVLETDDMIQNSEHLSDTSLIDEVVLKKKIA
jgi:hypothetical protein